MKIVISDKARSDLLQLYAYLAAQSPAAARKAGAAVDTKFANIAEFPLSAGKDQRLPTDFAALSQAPRLFSTEFRARKS